MNPHDAHESIPQDPASGHASHARDGKHRWMMIACCIPMLAVAVALVATGVVGVGFIFIALICTAMMALMMRGMSHRKRGPRVTDSASGPVDRCRTRRV